jgi:hypothetical protein
MNKRLAGLVLAISVAACVYGGHESWFFLHGGVFYVVAGIGGILTGIALMLRIVSRDRHSKSTP